MHVSISGDFNLSADVRLTAGVDQTMYTVLDLVLVLVLMLTSVRPRLCLGDVISRSTTVLVL